MQLFVVSVGLVSAAALRAPLAPYAPSLAEGRGRRDRAPCVAMEVATESLCTADAARLFGRLAETRLYLDPAVGACCHSACSDCEWREPDGGYLFDMMSATKPKWLPCYIRRDFEDERGCHETRWAKQLFDGVEAIDRQHFVSTLSSLGFEMPMGPRSTIKPEQAALPEAAAEAFWEFLAGSADASLSREAMLARLQDMSSNPDRLGAVGEGPDFVDWKDFARALGAPPFERW